MNEGIFKDPVLLGEIERYSRTRNIFKDDIFMSAGDEMPFLPIVVSGVLRVIRQNEEGREIFLYHLYPGETCAMAINCCQRYARSVVKAVAEEDTALRLIPRNLVEDWQRFPEWKTFINSTYGNRFQELIEVIDLIAFHKMDEQVYHYILERARATGSNTIIVTHQNIADELHTHREAISRLLRTMEERKIVKLGRNTIELIST